MEINNEGEIMFVDMTPVIKSDTFVNDDYKYAVISNMGSYVEPKNKERLKERAKERLALNSK